MIRKRTNEQMDLVGDKTTCDESKRRIQKLKQVNTCHNESALLSIFPLSKSPFPEERFDKENAHSDMADIKRSLDFASEVPSQPANRASLEPTIKPSNVLELQRQLKQCSPLVTKQQPKCQNETDKKVAEVLTSLPQSSNGSYRNTIAQYYTPLRSLHLTPCLPLTPFLFLPSSLPPSSPFNVFVSHWLQVWRAKLHWPSGPCGTALSRS